MTDTINMFDVINLAIHGFCSDNTDITCEIETDVAVPNSFTMHMTLKKESKKISYTILNEDLENSVLDPYDIAINALEALYNKLTR